MKTLQQTTLLLTALATGLMAGLARSSDRTFVETMQNIN
jgi:hypothetical protein